MTKILLIEDEVKIADLMKQGLEESGYSVELAYDGDTGFALAMNEHFDLIISDVVLPGKNGWAICRELRDNKREVPIFVVSAMSTTDDIVKGFDMGADDFLAKPFAFREFLVRIKSLIRRSSSPR